MADVSGFGVPSNNLSFQLEMFNKNKINPGKLMSKGKKSDTKENGPSLFKFYKKDKTNVKIVIPKSFIEAPVNCSTPLQNDSSSNKSMITAGKQVARIQPFSKSEEKAHFPIPKGPANDLIQPMIDDDEENDDFEMKNSSPFPKKLKLCHSTNPAADTIIRSDIPDKIKDIIVPQENIVDLTLENDEINWSFEIGPDDDSILNAVQPNNCDNDGEKCNNEDDDDDDDDVDDNLIDVAPDSPTVPPYFSPPPSPQQVTEEIPAENCDDFLYNEDELEEIERENINDQDEAAFHPLLKETTRQTPTAQVQEELVEIRTVHTKTMEEICSMLDKVDTDVLRRSLPSEISINKLIEAQSLRKKLRSKACKLEAMLKQRGESSSNITAGKRTATQQSVNSERSKLCSTPAMVNSRTSTSSSGSFIQSPPCGESFYTRNHDTPVCHNLEELPSTASSWSRKQENWQYLPSSTTSFVPPENSECCGSEEDWEMASLLERSYFDKTKRASITSSSTKSTPQFKKGLNLSRSSVSSQQTVNSVSDPSPKRKSSLPNDGDDAELCRTDLPYSKNMWKILRDIFCIKSLRTNQLPVINAAMQKKNCFVLMPTGGGKSLCYQVTALLGNGVTFVVSPLKSLIQDQVQRLTSMRIPATHLSGDITSEEAQKHVSSVYQDLSLRHPNLKLVYITPEKLSASGKLNSALANLHSRGQLDRFVIDEAHCISQWGHDFRPDYKKLSQVINKFQGVPIMALTATATPRVRTDIENQLRLTRSNCKRFCQSFNRPNLKFQIFPKKKTMEEMTTLIKAKYPHSSGIVYCLSRNECSRVADNLKAAGIRAVAYHAGLSDQQRVQTQETWIKGHVKVVCATIAFGMGIDKGDVRYVMHYSMPKSLEGYYQECGRAGRDGKMAECILYYSYTDMHRLRRMIDADQTVKDVHMDNLYRVVQFCENQTECRRVQLLHYFGETNYDRAECRKRKDTVCDNCSSTLDYVEKDVTEDAKAFVRTVNEVVHQGNSSWQRPRNLRYPLSHFVDVFKGSNNARVVQEGHERCVLFARGKDYHRNDAERLARMLVTQDVLGEKLVIGNHENVIGYAVIGSKAMQLLNGKFKLPPFSVRSEKAKAPPKTKKKKVTSVDASSDSVSSTETTGASWNNTCDYGQSPYWNDNETRASTRGGKRKRKPASKRSAKNVLSDNQSDYSSGGYSSSNSLSSFKHNRKRGGATKQPTMKKSTGLGLMAPPRPISRF